MRGVGRGTRRDRWVHRVPQRLDRSSLRAVALPPPRDRQGAARAGDERAYTAAPLGLSAQYGCDRVLSVARLSRDRANRWQPQRGARAGYADGMARVVSVGRVNGRLARFVQFQKDGFSEQRRGEENSWST